MNTRHTGRSIAALVCLLTWQTAQAEVHVVDQRDRTFMPAQITINQGDTIEFRNSDPLFHNVFSLSGPATFDLGSYGKGDSRKVVFDKKGLVDVECAIHADMHLLIEVK